MPPHEPDGRSHGTSAAVEYAVIALGIKHLIVMGHHSCGGVRGCHDMLAGLAPDLDMPTSFVGTWLRILKPGYEALCGTRARLRGPHSRRSRRRRCSSASRNLMTFPFVRGRGGRKRLELHGVWKDIRDGSLAFYDAEAGDFVDL